MCVRKKQVCFCRNYATNVITLVLKDVEENIDHCLYWSDAIPIYEELHCLCSTAVAST